jgi:hypothetical protein
MIHLKKCPESQLGVLLATQLAGFFVDVRAFVQTGLDPCGLYQKETQMSALDVLRLLEYQPMSWSGVSLWNMRPHFVPLRHPLLSTELLPRAFHTRVPSKSSLNSVAALAGSAPPQPRAQRASRRDLGFVAAVASPRRSAAPLRSPPAAR